MVVDHAAFQDAGSLVGRPQDGRNLGDDFGVLRVALGEPRGIGKRRYQGMGEMGIGGPGSLLLKAFMLSASWPNVPLLRVQVEQVGQKTTDALEPVAAVFVLSLTSSILSLR